MLYSPGLRYASENVSEILNEYAKRKDVVVDTDEFRPLLIPAGYTPEHSNAFHEPARFMERKYEPSSFFIRAGELDEGKRGYGSRAD